MEEVIQIEVRKLVLVSWSIFGIVVLGWPIWWLGYRCGIHGTSIRQEIIAIKQAVFNLFKRIWRVIYGLDPSN